MGDRKCCQENHNFIPLSENKAEETKFIGAICSFCGLRLNDKGKLIEDE